MGDGHIKWTAAKQWADAHGFSGEQFAELWYNLRAMDSVFMAHQRSK